MVKKRQTKRQRDIKTKLMAAICMLLVSSIMMVSTTYAWFTLSTAPEVTGINTAVGANGNLEMALMPKSGNLIDITSGAGDSVLDQEAKNVTWGNLVDLSMAGNQSIYGLDKITLFPSQLSLTNDGKIDVGASILQTPEYGADGRVSELVNKSVTGYFDKQTQSFSPNSSYGVRAVGTASGMTDRQLSYRNARSAANTARALAANLASQSLNNNGSALANIAITHGMGNDAGKYTKDNVDALRAIINDLIKTDGVLDQIETSYMQYILGYAASAATGTEDTVWSAVKGLVEADNATLATVQAGLAGAGLTLPAALTTAIAEYNETVAAVADADAKLAVLEAELATNAAATFDWEEISAAMTPMANASAMKVNGFGISEVKENLGELVSSITSQGGLVVSMPTGGGVYADIADQCGDYTASVNIEKVEYNGIVLNDMAARMETKTSVNPSYLVAIGTAVELAGAPAGGAAGTLPITDMYGYIIDLAFRTNASESNLLLQQEAADRIYTDNTNEDTMGHGASMTFQATTTDFSNDQVKALMGAIRIVFFNPADGTIYSYAKLDAANATSGTDGWTAEIVLYTITGGETTYSAATYAANSGLTYYTKTTEDVYTEATDTSAAGTYYIKDENGAYITVADTSDTTKTYYTKSTKDVYTAVDDATAAAAPAGTLYTATTGTTSETIKTDNVIMPLTQNTATALSVLVYLDGNLVTNASVAATGSSSLTGTMNLQFASSANLVPMEYADLHIPGAAQESTTPPASEDNEG